MTDTLLNPNIEPKQSRKVSALLVVGILFLPFIFAWFTLRRGYSNKARIIAFVWLVLAVMMANAPQKPRNIATTTNTKQTQTPSNEITLDKFDQLIMGMSYSQVVSVLGKKGTKTGENKFGDVRTEMYEFDCGLMCNISLIFSNGELTQKNQFGLD